MGELSEPDDCGGRGWDPPPIRRPFGGVGVLLRSRPCPLQPVDRTPQVANLRAAYGAREPNPAVRFQNSERAPESDSGLFVSEKRDFGVVLSLKPGSEIRNSRFFCLSRVSFTGDSSSLMTTFELLIR